MTSLSDSLNFRRPTGAIDDLRAAKSAESRERRTWEEGDAPLPALFISHGAPPALNDESWMNSLYTWGTTMPKPRAIVIVSAHWETAPPMLSSSNASTPLFYDFAGFHSDYYKVTYETPAAHDIAQRIAGLLRNHGQPEVYQDPTRGLDHGAFIPLMAMFPAADVPVIQLSMPSQSPADLLRFGEKLRSLRHEGVLVIGSGFMTHSFEVFRRPELLGHLDAFDEWAATMIHQGDVDALVDYKSKAPGAVIAHPTADHYVPLLLTMGAADDARTARTVFDRIALSNHIRSIEVH